MERKYNCEKYGEKIVIQSSSFSALLKMLFKYQSQGYTILESMTENRRSNALTQLTLVKGQYGFISGVVSETIVNDPAQDVVSDVDQEVVIEDQQESAVETPNVEPPIDQSPTPKKTRKKATEKDDTPKEE